MTQQKLFEFEPVDPNPKTEDFSTPDGENFYEKYLASPQWKQRRLQAFERAGGRCERCGSAVKLEVHHLTYDRLGREELSDLLVVCKPCHLREDELRIEQTESDRYRKSINSFGTRKYGEEWDSWKDPEIVREEFDDWLERRG